MSRSVHLKWENKDVNVSFSKKSVIYVNYFPILILFFLKNEKKRDWNRQNAAVKIRTYSGKLNVIF